METVVKPPDEVELHLLTDWTEPGRNARIGRSAILSLITHVAMIVFVLVLPETFMQPPHPKEQATLITPLVMPPLNLTQKEPNPQKLIREFRSSDLSPRVKAPAGPSPEPQAAAPRKMVPVPPPPPPKATPLPEPPKVEISANEPPKLTLPEPPPQAPPKSPFEDVTNGVPGGRPATPGFSLNGIARGALSGQGGANSLGTAPIASSGADLPSLLSDPKGVDFRPYLAQVKASVERVWRTIFPKNGHRGYVSIQFSIKRDGTVGKVVFVQQTGDHSMDDTAIQAISAGGPFGPLPVQYGDAEIHVQMNFSYNQVRR